MAETTPVVPQRRLSNCVIFVCDLQEKFRPAIHEFNKVILTTQKVLRVAQALHLPIYATTQNAARLGPTISALTPLLQPPLCRAHVDKTKFSMFVPQLTAHLPSSPTATATATTIVLVGIEAHICITQTALDALAAGYRVVVLADAVSSCNPEEVPVALARLRAEGATVTTSESWAYEIVGDAAAPEFKALMGIVKETALDTKAALEVLLPVAAPAKI